jgi:hypothetical protein
MSENNRAIDEMTRTISTEAAGVVSDALREALLEYKSNHGVFDGAARVLVIVTGSREDDEAASGIASRDLHFWNYV